MKSKQLLLTCLLAIVGSRAEQKAFAYDAKINGIYYNFSGSEATVTYQNYDGSSYSSDYSGAIVIPQSVRYNSRTYSVTGIGNDAFDFCSNLTSITIPSSVTSIGNYAFGNCHSLASITIHEGVTSIGVGAFSDCYALSSISLPETVQTIGERAFWSCINATKINIPHLITKIEPNCFYHCMALTSVTIPEGVKSIGYQAFIHCNSLATLICLPPTAPSFGSSVLTYTAANGIDIYVPAEGMPSYQNIGLGSECRLHSMDVGSELLSNKWSGAEYTVQSISYDSGVRYGNENESNPNYNKIVGVPGADANDRNWYDIDYSGNWAERTAPLNNWCNNFGDIYVRRVFFYDGNLPEELYLACGHDDAPCEYYLNGEFIWSETDGWFELEYYKLTEAQKALLRPGELNVLAFHVHQNWGGMYADGGLYTSQEEMGISNQCGNNLFWAFDAETGTLTITGTGDMYDFVYADANPQQTVPWVGFRKSIKHIVLSSGITSIGNYAFQNCRSLESVTIPESVTRIGEQAFGGCNALSELTLNEGLKEIGTRAFQNTNLKHLVIPNSVEYIGGWAFENYNNNPSLESVVLGESLSSMGKGVFWSQWNLCKITSLAATPPTLADRETFANYSADLYVPVSSVNAYRTAAYWSNFGTIVAIDNTPNIEFADAGVKALCVANWDTNGDGELSEAEAAAVTDLGTTFKGNKQIGSFNELQYFTRLTSISTNTFYACSGLTSITLPESVTTIDTYAFYGCTGLTSIAIPKGVTTIVKSAFSNCSGLTAVHITDLTAWCNITFENALSQPLYYAKHLYLNGQEITDLVIPESVTNINSQAFRGCTGLTSITFHENVTSIGNYAFYGCNGLTDVYCYAENVPSATNNTFSNSEFASAKLWVPSVSLNAYRTTSPWSGFSSALPIDGYVITDETTKLNIATTESRKAVVLMHQFTGDWEALYLPFAIDYDAIKADFELAEIDGVVQNDDDNDGVADFTVLSIIGFKGQTTTSNTPYLIRAKNAGKQTIIFEDVTIYPTVSASIDCSSTSTKYEFTGSYNTLNASTLANRYVVQGGELVKGASSLAPCRWYMTATARKGTLNLPSKIRIMPVDEVITGNPLLTSPEEEEPIYDLSGRQIVNGKLSNGQMPRGIYIVGRKKILR